MSATDKFVDGIERLFNSNVITAGKDIRSFLIELSDDEKLRDVVRTSKEGFRFEEEFRRVFAEGNPLPSQDSKIVALITGLMYSIDIGKLSLGNLLFRLYPDCDGTTGYARFLSDFIKPFAESFVKLLVGEPLEDVKVPVNTVYDKMNDDVAAIIQDLISAVSALSLDKEIIDDIIDMASGLIYVLSYNDALLTKNSYFGLVNTLRLYDLEIPQESELKATLKLYGVL